MKIFIAFIATLLTLPAVSVNGQKLSDTTSLPQVEVVATRAGEKTPVSKTNLTEEEIEKNNLGADLPFILNRTPSVVVNADAGNGIGYTGIRIRGSDASRINVTLNGIPYNDAESQGTFFVDLPDISSSANSIQIQRGVGTSSNGAGSFGGSINISTNDFNRDFGVSLNNSYGSYNSIKNTVLINSGLIGKHFTVDGRLSNIRSDGYIDRASSSLVSFSTSLSYNSENTNLRFNIISGKQKTYQAWNGVDEATLKTNRRFNSAGTEKPGSPYENETDNYKQDHYQLFFNRKLNARVKSSIAFFLTRGKGYYEQYKAGEAFSDYGLPDYDDGTTIHESTDLIRQLWLDNYFYGSIISLHYNTTRTSLIFGGNLNKYDGKHFGEVIDAIIPNSIPKNYRWYDNDATKTDGSAFLKWTETLSPHWKSFADMQIRKINYSIRGFRDNPSIVQENDYFFVNPKFGFTFSKGKTQAFISYARAAKEPNRDDFEAATDDIPKAEKLNDLEAGIERKGKRSSWAVNLFYMQYKDQLVLTGKINDVGAYTRTNIDDSYRTGIELEAAYKLNSVISFSGNATLSSNKVKNFTEYIDDYDTGIQQTILHSKSNLSFSPSLITLASVNITPFKNAEIVVDNKYVGRQYLDNTSNKNRSLEPYPTHDLRLSYHWNNTKPDMKFFLQINNLLSEKYEANGYTFSYFYDNALTTENYYFPMAPINVMVGVNVKF